MIDELREAAAQRFDLLRNDLVLECQLEQDEIGEFEAYKHTYCVIDGLTRYEYISEA